TDAEGHSVSNTSTPTTVAEDSTETITVSVSTGAAEENHILTATAGFTDSDVATGNAPAGAVTYQWQVINTVTNSWDNISGQTAQSFTPGETLDGALHRALPIYTDAEGHSVSNTSTPTTVAEDSTETITVSVSTGAAEENHILTATA